MTEAKPKRAILLHILLYINIPVPFFQVQLPFLFRVHSLPDRVRVPLHVRGALRPPLQGRPDEVRGVRGGGGGRGGILRAYRQVFDIIFGFFKGFPFLTS